MKNWFWNFIKKVVEPDSFVAQTVKERALDSLSAVPEKIEPNAKRSRRSKANDILEANREWIIFRLSKKDKHTQIAPVLGVKTTTLRAWIKKNHIVPGQQELSFEEKPRQVKVRSNRYDRNRDFIISELADGKNPKQIARVLCNNINDASIYQWLCKNKIAYAKHGTRSGNKFDASKSIIITMLKDRHTVKEVAKACGRSQTTLAKWLAKNEICLRELRGDGETSTDVFNRNERRIFELLRQGRTPYFIAKQLDEEPMCLYHWLKRFAPRSVFADVVDQTERQYVIRNPSSAF